MEPWFFACTTKLNLVRTAALCAVFRVKPANTSKLSLMSSNTMLEDAEKAVYSPAKLDVTLVKLVQPGVN